MKKLLVLLVAMFTFATTAFAQIGSLSADLVFTPITPCRIVDTRIVGGTIPGATFRSFKAWSANYSAQGGSASNCGLPQSTDISALAVNLLVISPASEGWIAAWPYNTTMPLVSNLNYKAGDVLANSAILKVGQTGLIFEWNLYTTSTTHFVADVTGYYSKPVATALNCTTVSSAATNVAAGAYVSLPVINCPASFTPVSLFISAGQNVLVADSYTSGQAGQIFVRSLDAATQAVTAKMNCCQILGR